MYFWIYRPYSMLVHYYQVCLFDDHGVDSLKTVSVIQWLSNSRILIVHGAGECPNEESYITYTAVPKMGCKDCNDIRKNESSDKHYQTDTLCIKCNLTIHTKYNRTDSDGLMLPRINFNYPDNFLIVSNGFIHAINVKLEAASQVPPSFRMPNFQQQLFLSQHYYNRPEIRSSTNTPDSEMVESPRERDNKTEKQEDADSIVAQIIADFAEGETKSFPFEKTKIFSRLADGVTELNELQINCGPSSGDSVRQQGGSSATENPQRQRSLRKDIVNNYRNRNIINNQMPGPSTSTSNANNKKLEAYEFSDETEEKCEKISLFRKKRLADKKYEFSEDNSENIVPFNRIRSMNKMRPFSSSPSYQPPFSGASPSSSSSMSHFDIPGHVHQHRASPNYGFRSPCGSPIGNRISLRSPPTNFSGRANFFLNQRSPTYVTSSGVLSNFQSMSPSSGMFSPKQHLKKSTAFQSFTNIFLSSPKPNCELQEILPPNIQSSGSCSEVKSVETCPTVEEKPVCSKKVVRRFVEETDAASVITNEDDCISPGYHTSLPLEVHGSCYSDMQMISGGSLQKLQCPYVQITQNSFDLEQFTYYVTNYLCEKNNKKYGIFYDWACELVTVCKFSGIATCVLVVHFTGTDKKTPTKTTPSKPSKSNFFGDGKSEEKPDSNSNYDCVNCSSNMDYCCVFHRKHYQCCSLFTWDTQTGEWLVLDYGQLTEINDKSRNQSNNKKQSINLRNAIKDLVQNLRNAVEGKRSATSPDDVDHDHIRVLESRNDKSKESLIDLRNCIEFYKSKNTSQLYSETMSEFYDLSANEEEDEEEDNCSEESYNNDYLS